MPDCGNWLEFDPAISQWDDFNACSEVPPTITGQIPDQSNNVGDQGGFDVSQYFDEGTGDSPVYTASALPAGASISSVGFITYDLSSAFDADVTVTLTTGVNPAANNTFSWVVNAAVLVDGWATESGGDWLTEDGFRWILE